MVFFGHGCAAVLLLALTQSFVSGSLQSEKNESASSIETISRYLRLPLSDGIKWLAHSSEHPDGEVIQKFVRGVESGETWTLESQNQFIFWKWKWILKLKKTTICFSTGHSVGGAVSDCREKYQFYRNIQSEHEDQPCHSGWRLLGFC